MSFQERIEKARQNQGKTLPANNNEQAEDYAGEYYGIENIRNHLACIDMRLTDGSRKALPYSYIMEINFEPSEGIEIVTANKYIKITGRDLSRLYDYLIVYRVRYIQASMGMDGNEEGIFVEGITIQDL